MVEDSKEDSPDTLNHITSMSEIISTPQDKDIDNDKAEAGLAQWAKSVRASFAHNRRDYNFAICDALASAGIQPTGRKVLGIGAWGT